MAETTDGTGTETPTAAPETAPVTTPDNVGPGVQARIDGLTAQIGRKDTQLQEATDKLVALEKERMSENERAISQAAEQAVEQFKKEAYAPLTASVEQYEAHFKAAVERMKEKIPEDSRPVGIDSMTAFQQFQVYGSLVSLVPDKTPTVGTAVNPGETGAGEVIAGTVFQNWLRLDDYMPSQRKEKDENRDRMMAARKENRIDWTR